MAPYNPQDRSSNGVAPPIGPHPSFIQVAKPYVFEQELQACMAAIGVTEVKEDTIRLQGVTWIDSVRQALQLPVRTYNTAVVYYHKFRLVHPDNEYDYRDAAAAALFNACKIEDTLKKSRDILCAAYNLKLPPSEHRSSDDPLFETHSKTIVGLERLMLEASGFDFRNRYPQKMLMKLVKSCSLDRDTVGMTAYKICLDLYRTFAPLKQTTQTMALACLELAIRLNNIDLATVVTEHGFDYEKWATTREEIMETLVDVLDLYTHHRLATLVGPDHNLDTFIAIRITLNHEASSNEYPRYTQWKDGPPNATPSNNESKRHANGSSSRTANGSVHSSISPQSPSRGSVGERGKDGTVRFMLDPGRAKDEKSIVKEYFEPPKEVEEEIEVEIETDAEECNEDQINVQYEMKEEEAEEDLHISEGIKTEINQAMSFRDVSLSPNATGPYGYLSCDRVTACLVNKTYVDSKLETVNAELERLAEATARAERKLEMKKRRAMRSKHGLNPSNAEHRSQSTRTPTQSSYRSSRYPHDHGGQRYTSSEVEYEDEEPYSPSDAPLADGHKPGMTSSMLTPPSLSGTREASPRAYRGNPTSAGSIEPRNPNLIPLDPRLRNRRSKPNSVVAPIVPAPKFRSPTPSPSPPPAPRPSGAPRSELGFQIRGAATSSPEMYRRREIEDEEDEEYEPCDVSPRTQYRYYNRTGGMRRPRGSRFG